MSALTITNSGRVALARSVMEQDLHVAWGTLVPFLSAPTGISTALIAGTMPIGVYYYAITAYNAIGETTLSTVVSFSLVAAGGIRLTWTAVNGAVGYKIYGRASGDYKLITTVNTNTFDDTHVTTVTTSPPVTNGTSYEAWTDSPATVNLSHSRLVKEVGRRKVLYKKYVVADPNGIIETASGKWTESSTPTNYVYLRVNFEQTDAYDQLIYQRGLFVGTEPTAEYATVNYLIPSMISNPGTMLGLSNIPQLIRDPLTRETVEIVLKF